MVFGIDGSEGEARMDEKDLETIFGGLYYEQNGTFHSVGNRPQYIDRLSRFLESVRNEERVKIQADIKSVLNFLDGSAEKEQIANYVREYLLEGRKLINK